MYILLVSNILKVSSITYFTCEAFSCMPISDTDNLLYLGSSALGLVISNKLVKESVKYNANILNNEIIKKDDEGNMGLNNLEKLFNKYTLVGVLGLIGTVTSTTLILMFAKKICVDSGYNECIATFMKYNILCLTNSIGSII